ncbi:MAG: type II secretion system F family protein [Candidatus Aenigmarchaeota archaeon]|nr:type II secretion system F family protein [Candidatus Aenigmarchaeota archaeon]
MIGLGSRLSNFFPQLSLYLYQSESYLDKDEYTTIALLTGIFWLLLFFSFGILLSFVAQVPSNFLFIVSSSSIALGLLSFFYVIFYPKVLVTRKVRELEKNLLFALRHLLIQTKSGIPLFDAIASVAKSNYGLVSHEFNEVVRKISTGTSDVDSLEELSLKSPSLYFRRALWQISNTIRAGADISTTLENIVVNLANEQRILVRKYGSQLNPLAFIYMMFGVIIPSLGIALLITLSSFTGLPIKQFYFWIILALLILFKFNFLGIVKSRRPSVEVYV